MNEKELRKLISEGLKGGIQKEELEIDPIDMADVDMSDEEKSVFSAMDGGEEVFDNFDDLLSKYRRQGGDYEGGYEDDAPVSPGYFNENLDIDDIEEIPLSMVGMSDKEKSVFSAMDGEEMEDEFIDIKSKFASKDSYEGGYEDDAPVSPGYFNEGKTVQITKEQLQKIIKEGVEQLHKKTLIENRLEQINQELNQLSNPDAWEDARNRAQAELEKKTLNWRQLTQRPSGLINESINENVDIDVDVVKDSMSEPSVQKMAAMFKKNPELAKRAAKFVADNISGINEAYGVFDDNDDYYSTPEKRKYNKVTGQPIPTKAEKKAQIQSQNRFDILSNAGLGALGGFFFGATAASTTLHGPDFMAGLMGAIVAGLLMAGIGALNTTSTKHLDENLGDDDIKNQIQNIIAFGGGEMNEMFNHPDDMTDASDLPVWKSIMMKIQGVSDEQIQYNLDNNLPLNWKGSKEGYYEKMEDRRDYSGSN